METLHNGVRFGNKWVGITFQYWNPLNQFTPIEWTLEKEAGWFTTSFTLLNVQIVFEFLMDRLQAKKWDAFVEKSKKEFDEGDYYSFIHHKNKLLSEFAEYMEANEGLRFWQALTAWTGKDITVGGEDPFYWEHK